MFSKAFVVLAFASAAFANVFITSPVATTTLSGGKEATITWQDDGKSPALKDFGPAKISIYVGNAQQQTSLQTISASVDVSTESSLKFTPDASIGPNGSEYFIRVESLSLKDASQPQFPALAFSSKFTMDSMTGTFSADILAQIKGQSTAPLATQAAPTNVPSATSTPSLTTSVVSKPASGTSAAKSTATSKAASGALSGKASWAGALLGALVGAAMF